MNAPVPVHVGQAFRGLRCVRDGWAWCSSSRMLLQRGPGGGARAGACAPRSPHVPHEAAFAAGTRPPARVPTSQQQPPDPAHGPRHACTAHEPLHAAAPPRACSTPTAHGCACACSEVDKAKEQLYNRTIALDTRECALPRPVQLFSGGPWEVPGLMQVKQELNATKTKLDVLNIGCVGWTRRAHGTRATPPPPTPTHPTPAAPGASTPHSHTPRTPRAPPRSTWGKHTTFTNRAGLVVGKLRSAVAPEMCTIAWAKMYEMIVAQDLLPGGHAAAAPASPGACVRACRVCRAVGCACVRACSRTCCRPPCSPCTCARRRPCCAGAPPTAFTLHLCEAPGAFVCATNHFLRRERPDWQWHWRAVSLNPYYEGNDAGAMIDDDALIRVSPQS